MANEIFFILQKTLDKIGRAIRIYHSKHNNFIDGYIPTKEFPDVLRYGVVKESLPLATEEFYKTKLQTFSKLADTIRDISGENESMIIKDLDKKILNLLIKLDRPSIEFFTIDSQDTIIQPSKQLDRPIVNGEIFIVDNREPAIIAIKLDTPEIYFISMAGVEDIEPVTIKLDRPVIDSFYIEESEEPSIVTKPLERPIIELDYMIRDDSTEVIPIKLSTPEIKFFDRTLVDGVIKEPIQLTCPIVENLILVTFDEEQETTVEKLTIPKIEINKFFYHEIPVLQTNKLEKPNIVFDYFVFNDNLVTTQLTLEIPSIRYCFLSFSEEIQIVSRKLLTPEIVLEYKYFDNDTSLIDRRLSIPNIDINVILTGPDAPVEPIQKLEITDVELVLLSIDNRVKPVEYKLSVPSISKINVYFGDSVKPELIELEKPVIGLNVVFIKENIIEIKPIVLSTPSIFSRFVEKTEIPEFQIPKLDEPTMSLDRIVEVEFEELPKIEKLDSPLLNLSKISVIESVIKKIPKLNVPAINLVQKTENEEEEDTPEIIYPEVLLIPIISYECVDIICVEPSIKTERLKVPIVNDCTLELSEVIDKVNEKLSIPGVITNWLVIDEDEPDTFIEKLDVPVIQSMILIDTNISAILGIAILGTAILGTK